MVNLVNLAGSIFCDFCEGPTKIYPAGEMIHTHLICRILLCHLGSAHTYPDVLNSQLFLWIQKFPRTDLIGFVAVLLFSTLESGFINIQLHRMRVDGIKPYPGKTKLRIKKYLVTSGRSLDYQTLFGK